MLGVWPAPGTPETAPKGGARSAPPFGMVSGAPGAVQSPNIDAFWVPGQYVFMILKTKLGSFRYVRGVCLEKAQGCILDEVASRRLFRGPTAISLHSGKGGDPYEHKRTNFSKTRVEANRMT